MSAVLVAGLWLGGIAVLVAGLILIVEAQARIQERNWPQCSDCGRRYPPPVYYTVEDDDGCTNFCVRCADELMPDNPNDPRVPAYLKPFFTEITGGH